MGCADRCRRAEKVRLHKGEGAGSFSGWLRLPLERRPGRKRFRKLKARLRGRLESGLGPIDGELLKLSMRRCRPTIRVAAPAVASEAPAEIVPVQPSVPEPTGSAA